MSELRRTAEDAEVMLQEWEASGLSLTEWARQKGFGYETVRRPAAGPSPRGHAGPIERLLSEIGAAQTVFDEKVDEGKKNRTGGRLVPLRSTRARATSQHGLEDAATSVFPGPLAGRPRVPRG